MPVPRRFDRQPPERDTTRINERIRVPEVRLIDEDGKQVGIKKTADALRYAQERELDLVEVAPDAKPPVCRVLDYSKYKYEQAQKAKAARKHQQTIVVREIKFRPKIAVHDYATKKNHVERFLRHRDKVKVTIMFRGREMAHPERGEMILNRLAEDLGEMAIVEQRPQQDGRNMTMLLGPGKNIPAKDEPQPDDVDGAVAAEAVPEPVEAPPERAPQAPKKAPRGLADNEDPLPELEPEPEPEPEPEAEVPAKEKPAAKKPAAKKPAAKKPAAAKSAAAKSDS